MRGSEWRWSHPNIDWRPSAELYGWIVHPLSVPVGGVDAQLEPWPWTLGPTHPHGTVWVGAYQRRELPIGSKHRSNFENLVVDVDPSVPCLPTAPLWVSTTRKAVFSPSTTYYQVGPIIENPTAPQWVSKLIHEHRRSGRSCLMWVECGDVIARSTRRWLVQSRHSGRTHSRSRHYRRPP